MGKNTKFNRDKEEQSAIYKKMISLAEKIAEKFLSVFPKDKWTYDENLDGYDGICFENLHCCDLMNGKYACEIGVTDGLNTDTLNTMKEVLGVKIYVVGGSDRGGEPLINLRAYFTEQDVERLLK